MNKEKLLNILIFIFFIFFTTISILCLLNIVSLNLARIFNTIIFFIILIIFAFIERRFNIQNILIWLILFFLFSYFTELLFLPNIFDYSLIFSIVIIIYLLISNKIVTKDFFQNIFTDYSSKLFLIYLLSWIIYSIVFIFFVKNKNVVFHRLQFIIFSFLIFISYHYIYYKKNIYYLSQILFYLGIFFILISTLEILTNSHFPYTYPFRFKLKNIAGGTSWNINDYATFLYVILYFLLVFLFLGIKNLFIKVLLSIFFICSIYFFMLKTDSRANLLGLKVFLTSFFLILLIIFLKNLIKNIAINFAGNKKILFLIIFILIFLAVISFSSLYILKNVNNIKANINKYHQLLEYLIYNKSKYLSSEQLRVRLILNGLKMLKDNKYLGVGPGQSEILMEYYSEHYYSVKSGSNVFTNLHNFWIELLVDYGVFIFILFLIYYIYTMSSFFFIAIKNNAKLEILVLSVLSFSTMMGFIISSNSVSSLLTRPVVWIYLSYITILKEFCYLN